MASLGVVFDIIARDRASRELRNVGDEAERTGDRVNKFGGLAKAGFAAAAVGVGALAVGLSVFVKEAAESAKIGRLTDAVIKSTGGVAKITAGQVGDLAEAISNKTAVDDEAIQGGANLLLTFTKVRNEVGKGNDIFNQAVQAATDMSVALGTDLSGASLQLGKALNDPIKGVAALGKAGVSFTEQQKAQIKTLVESGRTLDAQKIILGEFESQFGGAAAAAADPLQRLKVIAGNLGEEIGGALLPTVGRFATFVSDTLVPAGRQLADVLFKGDFKGGPFQEDSPIVGGLFAIREGFVRLADYVRAEVLPRVREFGDYLKSDVVPRLREAADFVARNGEAFTSLAAGIAAVTVAARIYTGVQATLNVVLLANPVGAVVAGLALLVGGLIFAYRESEAFRRVVGAVVDRVRGFAEDIGSRLMPVLQDFAALIKEKVTAGLALLRQKFEENRPQIELVVAVIGKLFEGFQKVAGFIVSEVLPVLGRVAGFFVGEFFRSVGDFIDLFGTIVRVAGNVLSSILGFVAGTLSGLGSVVGALAQIPGPFQDTFRRAAESISGAKATVDALKAGVDSLPALKQIKVVANTAEAEAALASLFRARSVGSVGSIGLISARAHGGPITAGRPYVVGELGPELVIPRGNATVIPADRSAKMLGGGGQTYNITMLRAEPESNAQALIRGLQSLAFRLGT